MRCRCNSSKSVAEIWPACRAASMVCAGAKASIVVRELVMVCISCPVALLHVCGKSVDIVYDMGRVSAMIGGSSQKQRESPRGCYWIGYNLKQRKGMSRAASLVQTLVIYYNVVTRAKMFIGTEEEAMRTVGVHELEDHIIDILRLMQQTGEIVEVTDGNQVIAHLVPESNSQRPAEVLGGAVWTTLDRLRDEINAHWPKDVSAVDAVRDVRREL